MCLKQSLRPVENQTAVFQFQAFGGRFSSYALISQQRADVVVPAVALQIHVKYKRSAKPGSVGEPVFIVLSLWLCV